MKHVHLRKAVARNKLEGDGLENLSSSYPNSYFVSDFLRLWSSM